jgi:glutamyl-tRNA(Gln) amidotransferase subunit D
MAKAGDRVRVITKEEEFEGILMPRPEMLGKDITVLKLDNGYNIGIDNDKITSVRVVKAYAPQKIAKKKLKIDKKLPTVTILSCGGTISSRVDYKTGGVHADYTAEDFVAMCPELANIANIKARKVISVMSEDMGADEWKTIAIAAADELKKADGVVVTMGTDMLHFATAALSFFLKDLDKPVIFTAAQRSIDRGSSDAFMNLICSVAAAAKSNIAEVMSCLHGTSNDDYCLLIRGTKVRKMHTSRRDAFRPINELPIAKVFPDGKIEILNKDYRRPGEGAARVDAGFNEKVALIQVHPHIDPEIIDYFVKKDYKGIVIAATALGHVPTTKRSLLPNIKKAIDKGIVVVIASQTLYGRTHPYVYTNLRKLSIGLGCLFAEDMLPETAFVKLGYVLSKARNKEEARKMMLENIAGEITERILPESFLY